LARGQQLRPTLVSQSVEGVVLLDLFDGLRDGIQDEGMGGFSCALGGGSDTRLQILFKSNGGGGHGNLPGEDQNVALK
jgi:hypothetical protein